MQKPSPLSGLPHSIQRDPKAVEAFLALRRLGAQQRAWWQLVGVSGVAVCRAVGARREAQSIASKAEGAAHFARQLLRQQERRMLHDKECALQERDAHLRAEFDEQLAGVSAAHAERVADLQQQIEQHLQRQEEQSARILEASREGAELRSQQRQDKDAITARDATIKGLREQLREAKQDTAKVQQEYDNFKQQTAKGQGWREALQHKVDEVSRHRGPTGIGKRQVVQHTKEATMWGCVPP